jgi:hypothetical protein
VDDQHQQAAIPFVIAQGLTRAGQSFGLRGLGLCGLFVVVHLDAQPPATVFDLIGPVYALPGKCSWIKTAACAVGMHPLVALFLPTSRRQRSPELSLYCRL